MDKRIQKGIYQKFLKRLFDIVLSAFGLVVLSPIFIVVWLLVRIKIGPPVIFKQQRPGKNEKIFNLYKFRSMTNKTDIDGNLLPDSERLTSFGRLLRETSLDELPELVNILIGNMSIVGPRPLSVKYLPFYTEDERHRHDVRPGLTGLAQVNGRNAISWEEKFVFDNDYVKNITFINDVKIVLKTIKVTLCKEDIGQGEFAPISLHILRQNREEEVK